MVVPGMCPSSLQTPHGKEIPVSYIGSPPYIFSNKERELVGGTDLEILDIYAKKFEFKPRVRKEPVFDIKDINGTKRGLVGSVRIESDCAGRPIFSETSVGLNWILSDPLSARLCLGL